MTLISLVIALAALLISSISIGRASRELDKISEKNEELLKKVTEIKEGRQ